MDQDRHMALQLAHEAEGGCGHNGAASPPEAVLARAEKYLAFLVGGCGEAPQRRWAGAQEGPKEGPGTAA